jgi:hypothetical protein
MHMLGDKIKSYSESWNEAPLLDLHGVLTPANGNVEQTTAAPFLPKRWEGTNSSSVVLSARMH